MTNSRDHAVVAGPFPVSVLMERRRIEGNPWVSESWKAVGVTVGSVPAAKGRENPRCVVSGEAAAQFLWSGLSVALFADEAESYYHNLMVANPGCYVVTRPRADGIPEPVLVTLSFDAGQAYQEAGETVYAVPLPPELYRATEAFVIANYVPEKKKKRKLENWKEARRGRG